MKIDCWLYTTKTGSVNVALYEGGKPTSYLRRPARAYLGLVQGLHHGGGGCRITLCQAANFSLRVPSDHSGFFSSETLDVAVVVNLV